MQKFTYVITSDQGIHARLAGQLVNIAKKFESEIILTANEKGKSADLKKILALMSLHVKQNEEITVSIIGSDEEMATEELKQFFVNNL